MGNDVQTLTKRQKEIKDFVESFNTQNGYAPTHQEIAEAFNLRSVATINQHLSALTQKGVIRKSFHTSRALEVIQHSLPPHQRPRGGCELVYPGKKTFEQIIEHTPSAELTKIHEHFVDNISTTNQLIVGDNLHVLKTLLSTLKSQVQLIYIDPPFGTGQSFVGYNPANQYSDHLTDTKYLEFLRERLVLMRELLSADGSIYVHIDQKIGHYVKILLDEIFGEENFRNDITRIKCNPKNFDRKAYGNTKDVIYFYSKSKPNGNDKLVWNDYRLPLSKEEIAKQFPKIDKQGKRYATTPLHAKGETRNGPTGQPWNNLMPPHGRHWRYSPDELTRLDKAGLIEWSSSGNPRKIIYMEDNRGKKIQDIWDFRDPGYEQSLYPTEKNQSLLNQIILNSSRPDDLVLDCFAGSGTTLAAAESLGRRWIGIDSNMNAIETIKNRLTQKTRVGLFDKPTSFVIYQQQS